MSNNKSKEPRSGSYRHPVKNRFELSIFLYAAIYFSAAFTVLYLISLAFNPDMRYMMVFDGIISFIYALQMTLHRKRYDDTRKKESIEFNKMLEEMKSNLETGKRLEEYKLQEQEAKNIKLKLTLELRDNVTHKQHLADVISGINHEISPWIGGISNLLSRMTGTMEDLLNSGKSYPPEIVEVLQKALTKNRQVFKACDQAMDILTNMSLDVKKVKNYAMADYNLSDTVTSWVRLILMDRKIKESISEQHIIIDANSLDFIARHSPMLISQIILNLAKNTVEHNSKNLENIRIKIYGNPDLKCLVYEDNGIGIKPGLVKNVFTPGFTTKADKSQHGFGLAACYDYCLNMGALIKCESKYGEYTRFTINFECDSSGEYKAIVKERKDISNKIRQTLDEESSNY